MFKIKRDNLITFLNYIMNLIKCKKFIFPIDRQRMPSNFSL